MEKVYRPSYTFLPYRWQHMNIAIIKRRIFGSKLINEMIGASSVAQPSDNEKRPWHALADSFSTFR